MYLEIGPVSLVIQGEKDGSIYKFKRKRLIEKVGSILNEIREKLPVLKQKACKIKNTKHISGVPKKMIDAVKAIDEVSLTPMAAVAGSVADTLKDFLKSEGPDLVSVNNGGDISVFNRIGKELNIHIGSIRSNENSHRFLRIDLLKDYGIATSGFGGRSFTLGLADSVTVIAGTGAIADAAATFICNCTNTQSDQVIRQKASEVDPLTDIPDELVTLSINQLNLDDIIISLENGLAVATNLKDNKYIYDTVITLQGHTVTTINGDYPITLEVHNGN
jgi:uncharacterized protein